MTHAPVGTYLAMSCHGHHSSDDSNTDRTTSWKKGVGDSTNDRINHWSLNGFGEPVFTGGLYSREEIRTLAATVKDYCASRNVTPSELCGEHHLKAVRGAWHEIAQSLPHRTVLSVYRRSLRMFAGHTTGKWSDEEVATLSHLVELHGQKWKTIQDKLGRSAHNCRSKFFDMNDEFERGRWSEKKIKLLLRVVRDVLDVPRGDMDVREINQWTLENNSKIPWTIISFRVLRTSTDCYFRWKQMTRQSNKIAATMGLEYIPMKRHSYKFDVKMEYYRWKAEQNPRWRQRFAELCVMPLLHGENNSKESQIYQDDSLLSFIIQSKANRPSEVSWYSIRAVSNGMSSRERFDELVDEYAPNDALDLPLYELARVVRSAYNIFVNGGSQDVDSNVSLSLLSKKRLARHEARLRELPSDSNVTSNDDEQLHHNAGKKSKDSPSKSTTLNGINIETIRSNIQDIIASVDGDKVTVKGVRKMLEKKLGIKLSKCKGEMKELIIEML